ncbi:MAG TPA: hypothetical protein VM925_30505 [Labilithrix sp.]|nr:hypothetical protein [Labilithrix sp.]
MPYRDRRSLLGPCTMMGFVSPLVAASIVAGNDTIRACAERRART